MYTIYCDETWTSPNIAVSFPCYVFYGLMLKDELEPEMASELDQYKRDRGLCNEEALFEIKWVDAGEEAKSAAKSGLPNRYEGYLDLFFERLRRSHMSFGYLFISVQQFREVEPQFLSAHEGGKHSFFFMLYFQFLYHCFLKSQVRHNPAHIYIDDRDMGASGVAYNTELLRDFLNRRLYRDAAPKFQLPLHERFKTQLQESVKVVSLVGSKAQPLVQLADLCAGCVRYVLENQLAPPPPHGQLPLKGISPTDDPRLTAKASLATYFYSQLRTVPHYQDIDLSKPSFHHRFSIFPFQFRQRKRIAGA
jgi:hypothetical protein